jgi:hypothetical protein
MESMRRNISTRKHFVLLFTFMILTLFSISCPVYGQQANQAEKGTFLLTIFLKHDQSKNLGEIHAQLARTEFVKNFPPEGVEIVSWYVMMGIGQVVTLRVPAEKLRAVNRVIEQRAWGAFRTEFYPTYDYKPIWETERQKAH